MSKKIKIRREAKPPKPPEKGFRDRNRKFPIWKGLMTSLIAVIIFIGLFEGVLALFGVEPELQKEDPFVGFASNIPLFVRNTDNKGKEVMTTAANKYMFFNHQQFPLKKEPGTYRIFAVGGSTTYGRPYRDKTSFPGWLRTLLPYADTTRNWEVINAGGISYASYRVAQLMQELVHYEPDLFIIYSGHNEFLEERTYGSLRDTPAIVKMTAEFFSRTRTWSAMSAVLKRMKRSSSSKQDRRYELSGEVNPILDRSVGLDTFKRDETLRAHILEHYRLSLRRMVDIARSAGADIIFVTPASNLKDSSPFKSQHTSGLSPEERSRSEKLLSIAMDNIRNSEWSEAVKILDEAISLDPRFAEHHYRRGRALFALGKYAVATKAFKRARDEDVCPLRAITPMREIFAEVARENSVTLVDFIDFIERRYQSEYGHSIPGEEYFLDHVHPTIKGNRLLAVELVETMVDMGVVTPANTWSKAAISEVTARVEGSLNTEEHARALLTLVEVFYWARKYDDSIRIARQILNSDVKDPEVIKASAIFAADISKKYGDIKASIRYFQEALKAYPADPEAHLGFGRLFLNNPFRNLVVASAHTFLTAALMPNSELAYYSFGIASAERGRYALAYPSVHKALQLNPKNADAKSLLNWLSEQLSGEVDKLTPAKVTIDTYTSGVPRRIVQVRPDATGRDIPDGIWTEWHENGLLKRFVEYENGIKHGEEIHWNQDGEVLEKMKHS